MNYTETAKQIMEVVGGKSNVTFVTHCATRLRMTLIDSKKIDVGKAKQIDGVIDVVVSANEYQFIIGTSVSVLFKEVNKLMDMNKTSTSNEKNKIGILDLISASFTPLLPALVAAGMIKAMILLLTSANLIQATSGFAMVMSAAGNSVFYFMPILLGFTIAKKLDTNPILAAVIGATLLEPNFTKIFVEKLDVDYLGIPMFSLDYASTIVPIFFAVIALSKLEKFLKKVIYKDLQIVFVPTISLFLIVSLTVLVFGPLGSTLGNVLTEVMLQIEAFSSIVFGLVMGSVLLLFVMFGLGWTLVPIILTNLANLGSDPILAYNGAMNFAIFGVAFGIAFKARQKDTKKVALSTGITGILAGISEPIIYGLLLRYRRGIAYVMIAGGISGAWMGLFKVKGLGFAFNNIFTLPNFAPLLTYIIGIIIAFVVGFSLVSVFGFKEEETEA